MIIFILPNMDPQVDPIWQQPNVGYSYFLSNPMSRVNKLCFFQNQTNPPKITSEILTTVTQLKEHASTLILDIET